MSTPPRLPPGPKLRFWQPLAYGHSPYRFFRAMHARYGDPFTVRTSALTVVTAHPEGIAQIFTAPADTFHVALPKSQQRVLGRQGLSGMSGEATGAPASSSAPASTAKAARTGRHDPRQRRRGAARLA
ncbi:cytochrome P450, partial [Methylogaea oryzae]|uniref:cytochrome P450 n=1 Tax=Methylogaea oryzae TaxID=1295382 RepID=UPI001C3F3DEB